MLEDLISIIVPVYKVEKFLEICINSIINQTYRNIEIIFVDDGSPDNCGLICDNYAKKDKRIRVIHKENGGLSDARNAGIEIAKGKYLCFVDSDDKVSEDFVEKLYKGITESEADLCLCGIDRIDENDNILDEIIPQYNAGITSGKMLIKTLRDFQISNIVAWNKIYKRDLFDNLRYPKGKLNEDEFITYKILYASKRVVIIPENLYHYRKVQGSIMNSKFTEKRLEFLDAYEERIYYFKEKNDMELYKESISAYIEILVSVFCSKKIRDKKIEKKIIKRYRDICKKKKNIIKLSYKRKMIYLFPRYYRFIKNIIK